MDFASGVAWLYAAVIGWGAREESRRTADRRALAIGGIPALFSAGGGLLMLLGEPAGRGIAILGGTLGALLSVWILSRRILSGGRIAPVAAMAALSVAQVLVVRLVDPPPALAQVVPPEPVLGIEEASGVTRVGDRLVIVGDHEPGTYYTIERTGAESGVVRLLPERLRRHHVAAGEFGGDLEAVATLADGRLVLLSERLGALIDARTIVATYPRTLAEFGGRGLEGVAARDLGEGRSRVAVLWEGGYPDGGLPSAWAEAATARSLRPVVLVHDVGPGETALRPTPDRGATVVELDVPRPPGEEPWAQRYRAPGFVWYRGEIDGREEWGFLVLLSSGPGRHPRDGPEDCLCPREVNGHPRRWCWKVLQRFRLDGSRWGEAYDLEEALPEDLRTVNWEGLGWDAPQERLVLVYDEKVARRRVDPQVAWVMGMPEGW